MRSLQTREQEIAEESIQPKFQSPWAPTFEPPPPLPESPASKLKGAFASVSENSIQRQCAECAKEMVEQKKEKRKEIDEIGIQTKLTVGAPGDAYEQEADQVAAQVMSMPDNSPQVQKYSDANDTHEIWKRAHSIKPVVQRVVDPRVEMGQMVQRAHQMGRNQASSLEANDTHEIWKRAQLIKPVVQRVVDPSVEMGEMVQRAHQMGRNQPSSLEANNPNEIWQRAQSIQPVVQRVVDPSVEMGQMVQRAHQIDGNHQASGDLESRLNASKGGGSPLSENVRGFMEPRFGADFSGVRVHTGGEAVQMNQELGAQAFTHGSDVYFGQGKQPGNNELMAHELTHVVQQSGGGVVQRLVNLPFDSADQQLKRFAQEHTSGLKNSGEVMIGKYQGEKIGVEETLVIVAHGNGMEIMSHDNEEAENFSRMNAKALANYLATNILPPKYKGEIIIWVCNAARPWRYIKEIESQLRKREDFDETMLDLTFIKQLEARLNSYQAQEYQPTIKGPIGYVTNERKWSDAEIYADDTLKYLADKKNYQQGFVTTEDEIDIDFYNLDGSEEEYKEDESDHSMDMDVNDEEAPQQHQKFTNRQEFINYLVDNTPYGSSNKPPSLRERLKGLRDKQ
jgi:hypothetical protein